MCKYCETRTKEDLKYFASNPRCAFGNYYTDDYNGTLFDKDNWNCMTMNYLRVIAREIGLHLRMDFDAGTIACVPFENDYGQGYIVMSYYKARGKVGNAVVMHDDFPIRPLTEKLAVKVVDDYIREGVIKIKED
jgi:hypothetical protein